MKKLLTTLALAASMSAHALSPAQQCLNSIKHTFKDPESGKVLGFELEPDKKQAVLIYSATNSYGGRIQEKTVCGLVSGKWSLHKDIVDARAIKDWRLNTLEKNIACLKRTLALNIDNSACTENSPALSRGMSSEGFNEAFEAEAKAALGIK